MDKLHVKQTALCLWRSILIGAVVVPSVMWLALPWTLDAQYVSLKLQHCAGSQGK
jgi:hypothetical protein